MKIMAFLLNIQLEVTLDLSPAVIEAFTDMVVNADKH